MRASIFRQVANGLQYAHEQGVVHRDIKPHNLMLSNGAVKILDFGLASLAEVTPTTNKDGEMPENSSLTAACSIMGTPDFMSPEQAVGTSPVDFRSDIYSLGASLYYLLAGQPPFASGSVTQKLERLADSEPTSIQSLRTDVPQALSDVISRMMAKDAKNRFQSAEEVEIALKPFVDDTPSHSVDSVQSSPSLGNWWPFSTTKTIAGAAAAALLFIVLGVVFVETDKGTLKIESVDDTVKVIVSQEHDDTGGTFIQTSVTDTITGSEVKRLRSGEYKLTLASDENEFELSEGGFVLRRGGEVKVTVSRKQAGEPKALKKMAFPSMAQAELIRSGSNLSKNEIKQLQAKADSDPNDVESRLQLLGYYSRNSIRKKELREPHQKLAMWFIKNYPDSAAAGDHASHVMGSMNPLGYLRAKELWLEQVNAHEQNVSILVNGADFFLQDDREKAEELLKKAQALEPDNTNITKKLALAYQLSGMVSGILGNSNSESRDQYEKAIAQYERALKQTANGSEKPSLLINIAKIAFQLGQMDKAKTFADRLLKEHSSDGDAVHYGNTVLGLLAVEAGKIEAANKYLIESGKTKGSPVLGTSGPSMSLANALLEKGQTDTVLEYFNLCEKFWTMPAGAKKLEEWKAAVEAGVAPDFKRQVDISVVSNQTGEPNLLPKAEPNALKQMALSRTVQKELIGDGKKLSKKEINELQAKADSDPNDVESRLQLLGYYCQHSMIKKELRKPHQKLAIWLIQNYPSSAAAGDRRSQVVESDNPLGYVNAREIWRLQVNTHDQNVSVLLNAAEFFYQNDDRESAKALLKKAQDLEPDNWRITTRLTHLYELSGRYGRSESKKREQNEKAMAEYERAFTQTPGGMIPPLLIDTAKMAFKLGQKDKAKELARRLLKEYSRASNVVHTGNTLLGLLALEDGKIDAANEYLIESGKTKRSQFNISFGPSMALANALLEKGQKDTVLNYFDLCEEFWTSSRGQKKLEEWKKSS